MKYIEGQIIKLDFLDMQDKSLGRLRFRILPREERFKLNNEYRNGGYLYYRLIGESVRKFKVVSGLRDVPAYVSMKPEFHKFSLVLNPKTKRMYLIENFRHGQVIVGTLLKEKEGN